MDIASKLLPTTNRPSLTLADITALTQVMKDQFKGPKFMSPRSFLAQYAITHAVWILR